MPKTQAETTLAKATMAKAKALVNAKAQAKRKVGRVAPRKYKLVTLAQAHIQKYWPKLLKKIRDEIITKKRHVNPTDVPYYFGDIPGDEIIRIEDKPQKRVRENESNPRADGIMDMDGTVVDMTTGHMFSSVNIWLKTTLRHADSVWRKVFYKGLPLEVYRQILIQEGGDFLFYPRFNEKNRKIIGHKDYLKVFIQSMGIQVCENGKKDPASFLI